MIRIQGKQAAAMPLILTLKGTKARKALEDRYDAGERNFGGKDFDNKIYGHKQVKSLLVRLQHGKCCFCESDFRHVHVGDVEHFRPKAGWVQTNEKLNKPGYYWLAYQWDNLLLSCSICNQQNKRNYFPLADNDIRALSHHDSIEAEEPLFIHPAEENAEDYIAFDNDFPIAISDNVRGTATINKLGLDREELNERRRKMLMPVRKLYKLLQDIPETDELTKQRVKLLLKEYHDDSLLDSTEYASMLRSFFKKNPVDF